MNCPSCADDLSERGAYCKACGAQARCLECRAVLEQAAVACVECGTRLGQRLSSNGNAASPAGTTIAPNRNTLSYHEDRGSRRFDASLTDHAMEGLGSVLGELFVQRGQVRTVLAARPALPDLQAIDVQAELPLLPATASPTPPPVQRDQPSTSSELATFFAPDGDKLELIDNRLKASNQSDYVRRLTLLFLYAHECLGRPSTSEDELKTVLKDNKVWDRAGNAAKWLKKRIGISDTGEGRLKLTAPGREGAKKTLVEAMDTNIQETWNPDKQVAKPRGPRGAKKS